MLTKHDQLLEQSRDNNENIAGLIKSLKVMQAEINSNKDMALKVILKTEEMAQYLQRDCLEISGVKHTAQRASKKQLFHS